MKELKTAIILLIIVVITGAFGAHYLRERLDAASLSSWHTAVEYQFYHAFGLVLLSMLTGTFDCKMGLLNWAKILMFSGVVLFSGSIYLLSSRSLHGLPVAWLGPITPLGGLCFIGAWTCTLLSIKNYRSN